MKLMLSFAVFALILSSKQCNCKCRPPIVGHYLTIRVTDSTPENPLQIYWNGKPIVNGESVQTSDMNTIQILNVANTTIADITIDRGAEHVHRIDISDSCPDDSCNKTLCGQVFELHENHEPTPISNRTVYNNAFVYTTTDEIGLYKLCFSNVPYDFGLTRPGWNNDVHITVNNQNNSDLKIDVYLNDSDVPFTGNSAI